MNINLTIPDMPVAHQKEFPEHQNILLNQLDTIPPSICTSIIVDHTLNYLTNDQLISLMKKMRHGSVITINSFDAMEIARALYWGELDIQKFSTMIANNQSQHSLIEMKTFFEQNGFVVQTASINGLSFNIKAKRP